MILGLYIPGCSPLHRLPAAAKMAGLFTAGIAVFLIGDAVALAVALAALAVLFAVAGVPVRPLLRQLGPVALLLAIILAVHGLLTDWHTGLVVVLRFAVLIGLAVLIGFTTRVSDMIAALERGLRPLAVLGINPAKVSLMLAMTIRFIPLLVEQGQAIRDAQRARGLDRSPVALLVPLLIKTLHLARTLTEAIDARGYDPD